MEHQNSSEEEALENAKISDNFETASENSDDYSEEEYVDYDDDGDDLLPDDPLCFSPPKITRAIRRRKLKKAKKTKILINSAEYVNKESVEDISSITDSLITSSSTINTNFTSSISAPPTSTITPIPPRLFTLSDAYDICSSESRINTLLESNQNKSMLL